MLPIWSASPWRLRRGSLLYPARPRRPKGELDLGDSRPEQIPLAEAIAALKPLLADPAVLKIGQNLKYDMIVLAQHGIEIAP